MQPASALPRDDRQTGASCTSHPFSRLAPLIGPLMSIVLAALAALQPLGASAAQQASANNINTAHTTRWSLVARRDLERAHELILEAHPGVLEKNDPAFSRWLVEGYRQALRLAERADTQGRAFAALQFYLVGFRDGHLAAWSDTPAPSVPRWAGWSVLRRGAEFRVVHRAAEWNAAVPPLGAKLISCDGQSALRFLEARVAPFVDRRTNLESTLSELSIRLTNEWLPGALPAKSFAKACVLESTDKTRRAYPLRWRDSGDGLLALRGTSAVQRIRGWGEGRFWIHASNFMLDAQDVEPFNALLAATGKLSTADVVVLDVRHNRGGNSGVGLQLLRALLKQTSTFNPESEARAFWRVSPFAISSLESSLARQKAIGAADNASFRVFEAVLDAMRTAAANGQPYVAQNEAPLESQPPETGLPFKGKLILLTGSHCASACLDFTDMIMNVPGAVHAGSPTSADSVYIDVGMATLPSGLRIYVPMKVWRNRARGNNEPRIPSFVYPGDIDDTAALQTWIADQVLPRTRPIGE